ncbi:D-Ala-D-Ala carboxypeptidase family metallohydrolase [Stenotrophomonas hibiscicola]|uniref:D-Ala-D-Ala carboxypeptidase family metallohydrolase n=1 Tax=Stenotrophomonas hibiscicola TaxID=86189 RepID=UPI00037AE1A5|nr:D-Ala-D-Ala carboxypeptidase family metallohydrolase [[Pseudomonas] hibiscicola]
MANFYEAFARGQANGLERQNAITQRNMLAELQTLAPQVMAGDLDATSRAYALDPKRAEAYQSEGNRQQQQLVGLAKTLKQYADNPQMQAGVYRSALPYLKRNFGAEIPDQFDAATVMPIVDQVLSVASNTPNFNGQTPTDVRSFQMMTQGLSPEDVERARRINLGLAGRESSAAIGYQKVKGPDGVERLVAVDPRQIGAQVVGDGTGYGSFSQPAPMAGGGNHFAAFSQLATEFPSVMMTSGVRSAERNAQVGGQPNSQHLNGTAADYAVPTNQKPAFISRARQLGYQAIDEGDHIHLQVPRGAGGAGGGANLFAGRRPEDEAAAVEAAKLGTQQQFLPQELAMRTQAALAQEAGKAQVGAQADANKLQTTRTRDANTALDLLDDAQAILNSGATGSLIGAGADRLAGVFGRSTQGAQATAALQTIAGQLTSKMPRMEGPQSDRDVQLYKQMAGDLANDTLPVQTRLAALEQIRSLNRKYANRQSSASREQGAQRTIVRRGTSNGRPVVQYSDGAIEYGN